MLHCVDSQAQLKKNGTIFCCSVKLLTLGTHNNSASIGTSLISLNFPLPCEALLFNVVQNVCVVKE